ncbi:tail fiber domain-containing protein, partial [Flavobacterium sp. NRK F7]|uniref:tail fiber domain-containing protein n=1 Tax=Flavobacterium sp. NRK F7 TaxID=2954930 RepID=UPI002090342A
MMKKIGCFIFFFSVFNFVTAQVGVNTTSPKASLDIQINDTANPTNEDGILIPRIDTFPSSNPTVDQNAMLVYLNTAVGTNNPGFYYWDNATTTWIGLQKAGTISKIIDTDLDTQIQVEASADEDIIRFKTAGVEFFNMNKGRINVTNTGHSTFLGLNAGANDDLTTNSNTAVGSHALYLNVNGIQNVALGRTALYSNTSNGNTAVGTYASRLLTTGAYNTAIGIATLEFNVSGSYNTALGANAGKNNPNGSNNTLLGFYAGENSTGSGNVFLGYSSGRNETGSNKLYIENSASGTPLVYGEFDTNLLRVNGILDVNNAYQFPTSDGTTGQALVTDGAGAITWTNVNSDTTKIIDTDLDTQIQVEESADDDTIRFDIAGTQYFTMKNGRINVHSTGQSTFLGEYAGLNDDLTNNFNTAIGKSAMYTNTTGVGNTAVGVNTLYNHTADGATAVGINALYNNTTGVNNTSIGAYASNNNTTGFQNTSIGAYALYNNTTGANNTVIGQNAGRNATGSGNIFIGIGSGSNETGDNKLYIENSGSTTPLVYGEFDTDYLKVNGNFDVGVSGDGTVARSNAWNTFSDRRWKTNFKKIENALDKLNQINGYYYNWKDKKDQSLQVGVIAQEIEVVLPEIVSTDKNGYKSVDYSKISALLIQVTKEQQGVIEKQEIKIEELSKKYTDLAKEIENMKQLLSSK